MREPPRHRQGVGPHSFDIGGIAASHHRQRALLGARCTAGDRCIDPSHAVRRLQPRGYRACRVRVDRRKIHDEFSGAGRARKAAGTEHYLFHGGGIGEAHEDDTGAIGDIARMGFKLRPRLHQCGAFARRAVPDGDVVAGVQQPPRHGKSHHSKPEIPEPLSVLSIRFANHCHSTSPKLGGR